MTDQKSNTDDTIFGDWVYCNQHLRPHTTGWCTVHNRNKLGLGIIGNTEEASAKAIQKCRDFGLKIYKE